MTISSSLPKFNAALQAVAGGTRNARIMFIGDSTGAGQHSSYSDVNNLGMSFPYQIASVLSVLGMPVNINSMWGSHNGITDSRVTGTAGNSVSPGWPTWAMSQNQTLNFFVADIVDTFDVYYIKAPSSTTALQIGFDGGAPVTTFNSVGASVLAKLTLSVAAGSHTINFLNNSSTGLGYIFAIDAYLSTSKNVFFNNAGWSGATAGSWATNTSGFDFLPNVASMFPPDLSFISLGINDWNGSVTPATYTTNLTTILNAVAPSGDVIFITPPPSEIQSGDATQAQQAAIVAAMQAVAATGPYPVADVYDSFATWSAANALGYMGDNLHPNAFGYKKMADMARAQMGLIIPAGGSVQHLQNSGQGFG